LDAKDDTGKHKFERDSTCATLHPITPEPRDSSGNVIYNQLYPLYNFSLAFYYQLPKGRSQLKIDFEKPRTIKKYNQFVPGMTWLDTDGNAINAHSAGMLFHNGTYYMYGEMRDKQGLSRQVSCYTSKDLYNWKNEGAVFEYDGLIERPKVIYNKKTKKFVLWFHQELKGQRYFAAYSGVAVSDSPVGKFTHVSGKRTDAGIWPINVLPCHKKPVSSSIKDSYGGGRGGLRLADGTLSHPDSLNILGRDFTNGQMARDQTLFVDDDGTAYHIFASEENSTLHIAKLSDDYLSHSGEYIRIFPDRYNEAPAVVKDNGKYYLISSDCSSWWPNTARSAVADSMLGEWKELGNPCIGEGANLTFRTQSTYILPVSGKKDCYIYMGDRWQFPGKLAESKNIWLPLTFENGRPVIRWYDRWKIRP
jgi:hypothetical protein